MQTQDNVTLMDGCEVSMVSTNEHNGLVQLADASQLKVSMVVAADTRFSNTRRQMGISSHSFDFGRTVILCWMEHEFSHQNTAFECFQYDRTMAVLPMPGKLSSIVISAPSRQAAQILAMSESDFNLDVQNRLNGRLGEMKQTGQRFTYPLVGVHADRFYANRFALVGDAAVGMHPDTAHGFNLCLSGQEPSQIVAALFLMEAITYLGKTGLSQRNCESPQLIEQSVMEKRWY